MGYLIYTGLRMSIDGDMCLSFLGVENTDPSGIPTEATHTRFLFSKKRGQPSFTIGQYYGGSVLDGRINLSDLADAAIDESVAPMEFVTSWSAKSYMAEMKLKAAKARKKLREKQKEAWANLSLSDLRKQYANSNFAERAALGDAIIEYLREDLRGK